MFYFTLHLSSDQVDEYRTEIFPVLDENRSTFRSMLLGEYIFGDDFLSRIKPYEPLIRTQYVLSICAAFALESFIVHRSSDSTYSWMTFAIIVHSVLFMWHYFSLISLPIFKRCFYYFELWFILLQGVAQQLLLVICQPEWHKSLPLVRYMMAGSGFFYPFILGTVDAIPPQFRTYKLFVLSNYFTFTFLVYIRILQSTGSPVTLDWYGLKISLNEYLKSTMFTVLIFITKGLWTTWMHPQKFGLITAPLAMKKTKVVPIQRTEHCLWAKTAKTSTTEDYALRIGQPLM